MSRAAAALAILTLRNLGAGRRGWAALLLLSLGPVLAGLGALFGRTDPEDVLRHVAFHFTDWIAIQLLGLVVGLALTSGEIEDGTAGYLYLAALPKWLTVLVQIGTAWVALSTLLLASLALTALAAGLGGGLSARLFVDAARAALAGSAGLLVILCWTSACGLAFRTSVGALSAAALPLFFWEFLVTHMPIRFAAWTVTNNVRGLLLQLIFDGSGGRAYKYVKNFSVPPYDRASMFLSATAGVLLLAAMTAAMNRSIEGKEAR
ncbi:MAG TPA: hypothetical protein VF950_00605 [Planctomycetota bacterium]